MNSFRVLRFAALYLALVRVQALPSDIFRSLPNAARFISQIATHNHHFYSARKDIK